MRKSNPGKYTRESEDPWHAAAKLNRSATWVQPCVSPFDLLISSSLFFLHVFLLWRHHFLSLFFPFLQRSLYLLSFFRMLFSLLVEHISHEYFYWLLNFWSATRTRYYQGYLNQKIRSRETSISIDLECHDESFEVTSRFLERYRRNRHGTIIKFLSASLSTYIFKVKYFILNLHFRSKYIFKL